MPKSVKSKSVAKKKKAAPKKAARRASPPKKRGGSAKVAAPEVKGSFMWKLLARKEAELKRRAEANGPRALTFKSESTHAEVGYARFNGPRRRAA